MGKSDFICVLCPFKVYSLCSQRLRDKNNDDAHKQIWCEHAAVAAQPEDAGEVGQY